MGRYSDDRGPQRRGYRPPAKPEPFVPWKPDVCEEPGCEERHPSYSLDGMKGPWRCRACNAKASPQPPPDPMADRPADAPTEPPQGRLL